MDVGVKNKIEYINVLVLIHYKVIIDTSFLYKRIAEDEEQ